MTVLTDAFCHILVVGSDQRIAEIPRMLGKHVIGDFEANMPQIPRMQGKLVVVDAESQTIDG